MAEASGGRRFSVAALWVAGWLVLGTLIGATPALAQDKVGVETGLHEGFARIVFAWPEKVDFEASVADKTLTIKFARPFAADLRRIPAGLKSYAASAAMDGASTVVVILKQPIKLRSFAQDNRVAIDLLDDKEAPKEASKTEASKAPPAEKQEAAAAAPPRVSPSPTSPSPTSPSATSPAPVATPPANTPPEVTVTLVEAEGTRRLVFEWPTRLGYATNIEKGIAQIRFKKAGHIDGEALAGLVPDLAPVVHESAKDVTVAFTLPAGSRYRSSHSGAAIFVDIIGPVKRVEAKPAPQTHPAETPPAPVANAEAPAAPAKQDPEKPTPAASEADKPKPAPVETSADAKPGADAMPAAESPAEVPPAPVDLASSDPETPLSLRYGNDQEAAVLRFDWQKPVPAAVFRRGPYLWVVFGAPRTVDLDDLKAKGKATISAAQQVVHGTATIIRLTPVKGFNPSIRRADNAWIITLTPQFLQPEAAVGVSIQPSAHPPRIFFGVREPGVPVVFRDPEVGDTLIVVPVSGVGQGVARDARLVDVTAFRTAQGIALRPANETVSARSLANGVEVTSSTGLVISGESDRTLRRGDGQPRLFDLADWYGPKDGDFVARRRALEREITAAVPASRSGPRLDLARFYFAHGMGPEARGVLQAIQRDDPSFAADPRVRAIGGAVALLDDDLEAAKRELGLHALDDAGDAALWRGSLAYQNRDWADAAREFASGAALLPTYPKRLRNRLALQAAEAAVAIGQQDEAKGYLGLVLGDEPSNSDRAAAEFLLARAQMLSGDIEAARARLDRLADGSDRPTRARARLARTIADLDSGAITRGQAIAALDALRFAWRGDDFELSVLRRLGELKLQDGDYRGGLDMLRQASANFPDSPDHTPVSQALANAFADIFVGKAADDVPPLRALALYDEYKDLTPAGPKGDAIIQKLADRLVTVDLLDRAADLLENQVKFRLTGRDKLRVATRLALVRLLDRKPDAALAALDQNAAGDIDPDLLRQRQQLRSRALLELGRADEALAIIANDNSRDADRLRADITWRTKRWGEAAKSFARLAPPPGSDGKLPDDAARTVLNWGTALSLANDVEGLGTLAERYAVAMEASPYKDAFRVLTNAGVPSGGDIRQVADKVAQVSDLQGFMAGYRQRLATDKLSAIN
jgi:hypothetical protein